MEQLRAAGGLGGLYDKSGLGLRAEHYRTIIFNCAARGAALLKQAIHAAGRRWP